MHRRGGNVRATLRLQLQVLLPAHKITQVYARRDQRVVLNSRRDTPLHVVLDVNILPNELDYKVHQHRSDSIVMSAAPADWLDFGSCEFLA